MFDYETLRILWWLLLGALLIGFAIMDGFDLGVAALLRVLAHEDAERRALLETIEPVWEGNQVWLILGVQAQLDRVAVLRENTIPTQPSP